MRRGHLGAFILFALAAGNVHADGFDIRVMRGSVQLGADLEFRIDGEGAELPDGALCDVVLPPPFDGHAVQGSRDCRRIVLHQKNVPITDADGYAIASEQVPATVLVRDQGGAEIGRVETTYPYNNQFSDLRVLIRDVRNPVSEGQTFEAEVQGARQPIDPALTCRWDTYGPVNFTPSSENACKGTLTVLAPSGRDADMNVQIVNMTDMHAVGYATASMIVE